MCDKTGESGRSQRKTTFLACSIRYRFTRSVSEATKWELEKGTPSPFLTPLMGCLQDPASVQQTSSKCIQNTRANAWRLLDRVNTLSLDARSGWVAFRLIPFRLIPFCLIFFDRRTNSNDLLCRFLLLWQALFCRSSFFSVPVFGRP